jgi:tRNA wybutosine-synthesizing protein 4
MATRDHQPPTPFKQHIEQYDLAVQGTNDCSVLSKRSIEIQGYLTEKQFLRHFISKKPPRRAPLINRGYYIRAKAIQTALDSFLTIHDRKCQVISLGCGFDATFFRLANYRRSPRLWIDVDFPDLVKRKHILINGSEELTPFVNDRMHLSARQRELGVEILTPKYMLVGQDLKEVDQWHPKLQELGVDLSLPTLLISECVLTYVPSKYADKIIQWGSSTFSTGICPSFRCNCHPLTCSL